jgi:HD-GYP domain-containing protein (c-di-GMP phosphodiesterase class II)
MHQHTVMGEQILMAAGPSTAALGPLVRSSHERWDGKGYPDGLAGEEIPVGARIIAICDAFYAMMTTRSYKSAMSLSDALTELLRCAGTQFDPRLVHLFCSAVAASDKHGRPVHAPRHHQRRGPEQPSVTPAGRGNERTVKALSPD